MNVYDKLVARFVLKRFRMIKEVPYGPLGGTNNLPDNVADLFRHLQSCDSTNIFVLSAYEGPLSDVTPDPEMKLSCDVQCQHVRLPLGFEYMQYGEISDFINWVERELENDA